MGLSEPAQSPLARILKWEGVQAYLEPLGVSIPCWFGIVGLESSQVFASDAARGYVLPTVHYLAWAAFNWYALALFTPLIYQLGRRYPITGPNWATRLIFPHAMACAGCLIAQAVFRALAGWLYTLDHETPSPPTERMIEWLQDRLVFGLIIYCVIVIVAGFAHLREEVRQRELRQAQLETRLASAELEKLRMQIQPHFLFNTLQAATTLVHDDPRGAEDVLLRLSELLRISLDQIETNEIPLSRELEILDLYTGIQRCRFGDRLSVKIHAEPATLHLLVPPLILQPLVENAIRHGIGKHKGEDCVEVFAREVERGLQIEIWNANSVVEEEGQRLFLRGVGLRNTRARLEQFYGSAASLAFCPLARGGATVIIFVPARPSLNLRPQGNVNTAT